MNWTSPFFSFVSLDFCSYWYHRACHRFEFPWHHQHHLDQNELKVVSVEKACLLESTISGLLIYSGMKVYEKYIKYPKGCRATCAVYWLIVSSSHYLGHKLDYSDVFPINKIQIKHLFHHENPSYNFSVILPFDVVFGTSNLFMYRTKFSSEKYIYDISNYGSVKTKSSFDNI